MRRTLYSCFIQGSFRCLLRDKIEGAPLLHSASKRRTHETTDTEEMENGDIAYCDIAIVVNSLMKSAMIYRFRASHC